LVDHLGTNQSFAQTDLIREREYRTPPEAIADGLNGRPLKLFKP
jgi:hypothetical protein